MGFLPDDTKNKLPTPALTAHLTQLSVKTILSNRNAAKIPEIKIFLCVIITTRNPN